MDLSQATAVYIGNTPVIKIYLGSTLIWQAANSSIQVNF